MKEKYKNGNLIDIYNYENGKEKSHEERKYNNKNNIVERINPQLFVKPIYKIEIKYDKYNNEIEEIHYKKETKFNKTKLVIDSIIITEYEYW